MAGPEPLTPDQIAKLQSYYDNEFNLEPALRIITTNNFAQREWGFMDCNGRFDRNFSFLTPKSLEEYIKETCPRSIYVGAVYNNGPENAKNISIHQLEWQRRELIFDIDLTEYDEVRPCSCRGKNQVCDKCWELVKTASFWIHDTLVEDFGVSEQNIQWIFSGRRGLHAWVKDYEFAILDNDQRTALIDYLTLFKGTGTEVKLVEDPVNFPPNLRNRLINLIFIPFFRQCTRQQLMNLGFTKERALSIMQKRESGVDQMFLNNHVFVKSIYKDKIPLDFPSPK